MRRLPADAGAGEGFGECRLLACRGVGRASFRVSATGAGIGRRSPRQLPQQFPRAPLGAKGCKLSPFVHPSRAWKRLGLDALNLA